MDDQKPSQEALEAAWNWIDSVIPIYEIRDYYRESLARALDTYAGLCVMDAKRDLLLALAADFSREAAAVRVGASDPMARYASSFDRGNLIGRAELLEELAEEITKSGGLKFPFADQ